MWDGMHSDCQGGAVPAQRAIASASLEGLPGREAAECGLRTGQLAVQDIEEKRDGVELRAACVELLPVYGLAVYRSETSLRRSLRSLGGDGARM